MTPDDMAVVRRLDVLWKNLARGWQSPYELAAKQRRFVQFVEEEPALAQEVDLLNLERENLFAVSAREDFMAWVHCRPGGPGLNERLTRGVLGWVVVKEALTGDDAHYLKMLVQNRTELMPAELAHRHVVATHVEPLYLRLRSKLVREDHAVVPAERSGFPRLIILGKFEKEGRKRRWIVTLDGVPHRLEEKPYRDLVGLAQERRVDIAEGGKRTLDYNDDQRAYEINIVFRPALDIVKRDEYGLHRLVLNPHDIWIASKVSE